MSELPDDIRLDFAYQQMRKDANRIQYLESRACVLANPWLDALVVGLAVLGLADVMGWLWRFGWWIG